MPFPLSSAACQYARILTWENANNKLAADQRKGLGKARWYGWT